MDSARLIIEVVAGLLPGKDPDPAFTMRFGITSEEWRAAGESSDEGSTQLELLRERANDAQAYAMELMMRPDRLNWVRTDWIWL